MALHRMSFLLVVIILATKASGQSKPGCSDRCGSLTIPYPFGTTSGCYLDESFLVSCNISSDGSPPNPFLGRGNATILNITLDGELRISTFVARKCYNQSGLPIDVSGSTLNLARFLVSNTKNKFTAVGCDTIALVLGSEMQNYTTGCLSLCDKVGNVVNGSCSGVGCCQTSIPQGVRDFSVGVSSLGNHTSVFDFNPCSYAFVVEDDAYSFSSLDLRDFQKRTTVPIVLDWTVGNLTCEEAQKDLASYECRAANSQCYNSSNAFGYRCKCSSGFEGNPYLVDGCQGTQYNLYFKMKLKKLMMIRNCLLL